MLFFYKRKFEKLVNEKEAVENFTKARAEMEKGDFKAMVIAALIVFLPVILLITGVILFLAWLIN